MNFQKQRIKLLTIFLSLSIAPLCVWAQPIDEVRISGIENTIALKTYVDQLNGQKNYRFFYAENMLDGISLTPNDNQKLLIRFLDDELLKHDLTYLVYRSKNLVFMTRSQLTMKDRVALSGHDNTHAIEVMDIGNPRLAGKYKKAQLHGYVRNGTNGDPLPGAVIQVAGLKDAVITDHNGYYSLVVPVGQQLIRFNYVGFENKEQQVNMISPGSLDVELFEKTVDIDQVVITHNARANVLSTEMSIVRLDARTISSIPVLMGEPDLLKTMTLMPGVQSSGDLSSGFNVRGGSSDQNLITLDGVPIYNANHLFGMFSVMDASSIDNLELHKGGVSARYGGRISSYMDINLLEGNKEEFEGNASAGLFNSKVHIQGPILRDRVSYSLGGRTTYSDWILKRIPDAEIRNSSANFYDWNAKLSARITPKLRLNVFGYGSKDYFDLGGASIFEYTNQLASAQVRYIVNDQLSFSINGFSSEFASTTVENSDRHAALAISNGIIQKGSSFRTRAVLNKHSIEVGAEFNDYNIELGQQAPYGIYSNIESDELNSEQAQELSIYLQDEYTITELFSVNAGVRYNRFLPLGPATVNTYNSGIERNDFTLSGQEEYAAGEEIIRYSGWEPRLGMRYILGVSSSLKMGYSRTRQNLQIISNSTVIIPTDTWKISDSYVKPAVADQFSFGFFRNLKKNIYEASAEVYYKHASDVLEFKSGAVLVMNPDIEQDILSADVEAYGLELLLRKNIGNLSGWVSYTYSRAFMETYGAAPAELVNRGERYKSSYDKPHDLSVVANMKLTRRLSLGSSFVYSTGRPVTYPESTIMVNNNPIVLYSDRNKYRLPDYHRLDLSLTWNVSLRKTKAFYSSWTLSVFNVYGRKNIYSTYYRKADPSAQNNYQPYSNYRVAIIGVPIPSLTYNLKF